MTFELSKNVYERTDDKGVTRHLRHIQEPYVGNGAAVDSNDLARQYVGDVQKIYEIDPIHNFTLNLAQVASDVITPDGNEIRRFKPTKSLLGTDTVSFVQTRFGLPIWEAGLAVTVQRDPLRVTSSLSTVHLAVEITKPVDNAGYMPDKLTDQLFKHTLGPTVNSLPDLVKTLPGLAINGKRLLIYQFNPKDAATGADPLDQIPPSLPVPDVQNTFTDGKHYVVAEVLFSLELPRWGTLSWRAFVEVETGKVVYLRSFVSGVVGRVFPVDPPTRSGDTSITAGAGSNLFTEWAEPAELLGLDPDADRLIGDYVEVTDLESPVNVTTHANKQGNFDFDPSTQIDHFSAVCAYYHCDNAFRLVEDSGLDVKTFFSNTIFPVKVDPWSSPGVKGNSCSYGDCVNASTSRSSAGVIEFRFAHLDFVSTLSSATDRRAILHEFGHALLFDAIGWPNLGFAHSAGDSLAAIQCDPGTQLKDRFATFPWISASLKKEVRRHDRSIDGLWKWGGPQDKGNYKSEQILSTTLFRAYLAAGGAACHSSPSVQTLRRRFAARFLTYLIVCGIKILSPTSTTPTYAPDDFATALMDADSKIPGLEGHSSGAFQKVISWAFENGADPK